MNAMGAQTRTISNDVMGCPGVASESRTRERHTILLVEDEDFVRRVACEILCEAGYTVIAATKASEALLTYEQQHAELLLTDVVLPEENGRTLAQKIRRMNPSIKVLLMTGYAEQMGQELTEHEEFLRKPFASGELLGRVARLLESRVGVNAIGTEENLIKRASGDE
jgi:two-component system, cell cycle sensor histidine kinase and response regulator CckA